MPDSTRLPAGKLPPDLLASLLGRLPEHSTRLIIGPGVGEDAAVLSFGATSLIAKADPVTFATDLIGWYAVNVNANDIAASGGTPKWFMPTVLLPENVSTKIVEGIFTQLQDSTEAIGVELIGGHTEITVGLPRPIICGAMLGEAPASNTISTRGARPGDEILLTKGIAVEGTSLLAREFRNIAVERGVPASQLATAEDFLFNPGISVLKDASVAMAAGTVTAMHDPTEGGLASALAELSTASGNGMMVDYDSVRVLPECIALCDALSVDPWGLIASGALLITCAPGTSASIIDSLAAEGISANVIGRMTSRGEPAMMSRNGEPPEPLPVFARDEIARLFEPS